MIIAFMGILVFITACGSSSDDTADTDTDDTHMEEDEHLEDDEHTEDDEQMEDDMDMDHAHVEPPDEFASLTNSFGGSQDAITSGQEIYELNCATCHGPEGAGDGPGSVGLDPKPANLGDSEMMHDLSDGYLFWRVTKGGAMEPFNSVMPSWEGLSEEQRWQVISYVRTLSE
jgi:hypothetical protein